MFLMPTEHAPPTFFFDFFFPSTPMDGRRRLKRNRIPLTVDPKYPWLNIEENLLLTGFGVNRHHGNQNALATHPYIKNNRCKGVLATFLPKKWDVVLTVVDRPWELKEKKNQKKKLVGQCPLASRTLRPHNISHASDANMVTSFFRNWGFGKYERGGLALKIWQVGGNCQKSEKISNKISHQNQSGSVRATCPLSASGVGVGSPCWRVNLAKLRKIKRKLTSDTSHHTPNQSIQAHTRLNQVTHFFLTILSKNFCAFRKVCIRMYDSYMMY